MISRRGLLRLLPAFVLPRHCGDWNGQNYMDVIPDGAGVHVMIEDVEGFIYNFYIHRYSEDKWPRSF